MAAEVVGKNEYSDSNYLLDAHLGCYCYLPLLSYGWMYLWLHLRKEQVWVAA